MDNLQTTSLHCGYNAWNRERCDDSGNANSSRPFRLKLTIKQVSLARQHNIPFLGTGGRHGYSTTLGNLQGGLAIDLSKLKSITIDKRAATVTIGPGVRFEDIFEPLFQAGYMLRRWPYCTNLTCKGI